MLFAILCPKLSTLLHHIFHRLIYVCVPKQGIFRHQDAYEILRSPELSEVEETFLDADFAEIHAVDIHQHEVEAFVVLLPEHVAGCEVLVQNVVIMYVGCKVGECFR